VKDVHRTVLLMTKRQHSISSARTSLFTTDSNDTQALPIRTEIAHVKGHQDRHKQWDELDIRAQINVIADRQANDIYRKPPGRTGVFPTWVPPGTRAALFHRQQQVIKGIPAYIRDAEHTPAMK
jgi:hypothetical protein